MGRVRIHYPQMGEAVLAQKTPITLGSLAVGETVTLNVDGAPREWIVVHQGKPSSVYDDTCDGTWLLMRDLYQKGRYGTGSDGRTYSLSVLRSTLNTRIYNLLDQSVREAIRQTNLPARVSGDRVFPLTCTELGLSQTYMSTEGAVLQYFAGADAQKRVAKYGGVAMGYWTPSPYTYSSAGVWYVTSGGSAENIGNVQAEYGVRPAIILPADFVLPAPATLTDLQGNPLSISAEQVSGGVRMATGSYTGDGTASRAVNLGFKPVLVIAFGYLNSANKNYMYAQFTTGGNEVSLAGSGSPSVNTINSSSGITITDTGFKTSALAGNFNAPGEKYNYIALG